MKTKAKNGKPSITKIYTILLTCVLIAGFTFCNNNNKMISPTTDDPKGVAEDQNNAKFDEATADDATFLVDAAMINMAEIKLGELAQKQAMSADVKALGKMMVEEHTKAMQELDNLAATKQITLPTDLDEKHKALYQEMTVKSGAKFDKDYADQMVKGHEEAIEKFTKAGENTKDKEVKLWATNMLSSLQMHLSHSKMAQEKTGK